MNIGGKYNWKHAEEPARSMNILALDLGTTTGWAIRLDDGGIFSGSQSFKPGRFEGGGMRYLKLHRWLCSVTKPPTEMRGAWRVVFEEVRNHAGVDAAHAYGGFLATLTAWCEELSIPYQGVPVGTIKKHATGKGNASKGQMIEVARGRGIEPSDDNEADAHALLYWAMEQHDETASGDSQRPAPDREARRRVQVGAVPVAVRGAGRGARRDAADPGRPDGREGLPPGPAGEPRRPRHRVVAVPRQADRDTEGQP